MTYTLANLLAVGVVFACVGAADVNVEKRFLPIGPNLPGLDLVGKGGLVDDVALKALLTSLAELIKNIRKTLEGLNICPKGDYKEGGYEHQAGGYEHHEGGYGHPDGGYEHHEGGNGYNEIDHDNYEIDMEPDYAHYKRGAEDSKLDMACQILKPIFEAAIKTLRQLEKLLGCMNAKPSGYKGDYKECH